MSVMSAAQAYERSDDFWVGRSMSDADKAALEPVFNKIGTVSSRGVTNCFVEGVPRLTNHQLKVLEGLGYEVKNCSSSALTVCTYLIDWS